MAEEAKLPPAAQAAAVRQMMHDAPSLTLDKIAADHPGLADGVKAVRESRLTPRPVGSGSAPLQRTPIS